MTDNFVRKIESSKGESWREVVSKTYELKDIIDYLQECVEEPQKDTMVTFTIREGGDLYIATRNKELAAEVEATGFSEIKQEK